MGLTYVKGSISHHGKKADINLLVDSGAIYSVLPKDVWKRLGLKSTRQMEFTLADGTTVSRNVSECRFDIYGQAATSPVILGLEEDAALLGAVTLEALGLMLNPLTRKIIPMKMILA